MCGVDISTNRFFCEKHAKQLSSMLENGIHTIANPKFSDHCMICGQYQNRMIVSPPYFVPICDKCIKEELGYYSK